MLWISAAWVFTYLRLSVVGKKRQMINSWVLPYFFKLTTRRDDLMFVLIQFSLDYNGK